jgi:molecular chaperone GrpE (heat shock protein)
MTAICKRALADLDNYQKSASTEMKKARDGGAVTVLKEFLTVLDSFERGKAFFDKLPEEEKKGIESIYQLLKKTFEKCGVKEIATVGQKVDTLVHEPLLQGPGEPGIILEELEKGYTLGSIVLRPAKVKIGS